MSEFQFYKPIRFYRRFFYHVTRFLLWKNFDSVLTHNIRVINDTISLRVFICNHSMWLDGLLPLYINESFYAERGIALMDDIQVEMHPFFRKIGAQPLNRSNPKIAIQQLSVIHAHIGNEPTNLFVFPEGKIVSLGTLNTIETGFIHALKGYIFLLKPLYFYHELMWTQQPRLHLIRGDELVVDSIDKQTISQFISNQFTSMKMEAEKLGTNQKKR